jgi:DNA-binding NtrC family response regulator
MIDKYIRRQIQRSGRKIHLHYAATHRDLAAMIEEGSFRRDLYFRLCVGCVVMPPLRERGDDLLRIAERILGRLAPPARLDPKARPRLLAHRWPGNIRELENVLSVAAALAGGGAIGPHHLELPDAKIAAPAGSYHQRVRAFRRQIISEALDEHAGNRAAAAAFLGVSRQSISYFIRELGLVRKRR